MAVPKNVVISLCIEFGSRLSLPPGLDGTRVLKAIASNESSLGANTTPRHEPAYDFGGKDVTPTQAAMLATYGSAAAYSYGPWQILPCNAPGYSPQDLDSDPRKAAIATFTFINRYVIGHWHAETMAQIAEVYNSGHIDKVIPSGVQQYIDKAVKAYSEG